MEESLSIAQNARHAVLWKRHEIEVHAKLHANANSFEFKAPTRKHEQCNHKNLKFKYHW